MADQASPERRSSPRPRPDDDVLRVEHIAKRFGPVTALRDISLHLRKGEVLGLLGDNGAGKSTLIKSSAASTSGQGTMWLKGETTSPRTSRTRARHGHRHRLPGPGARGGASRLPQPVSASRAGAPADPVPVQRLMRREARDALDEIGINIPRLDVPVARLSGGQRQAIAVARTVSGEADILLLDEPLAAMGAKEGGMILELIERLKAEANVSIIMILHNYIHVLATCDRVNLIQDGVIALDKPTTETSVEELTEIVVEEYRRARLAATRGAAHGAARRRGGRLSGAPRAVSDRATRSGSTSAPSPAGRCCSIWAPARSSAAGGAVRSAVIDRTLPGAMNRSLPTGRSRIPTTGCGARGRLAYVVAAGGGRTGAVVGIGSTSPPARCSRSTATATPLCRYEHWRGAPARVAQALEAPRRPAGRRPSERGRAERGEEFLARYGGRISSEWYFPKLIELWLEDREVYDEAYASSRRPTGSSGG